MSNNKKLFRQVITYIGILYWWGWGFSHSVMSGSCNPMDCTPPGSSVHGISQARILEWVNKVNHILFVCLFLFLKPVYKLKNESSL